MTQALRDFWAWATENARSEPVALAIQPHGLIWDGVRMGGPDRLNTQDRLDNHPLQEIGIRFYPAGSWKTGAVRKIRFTSDEFVDIDTPQDLAAARHLIKKSKTIIFRIIYGPLIGTGHLYRSLAIAQELQHHNILFSFASDERPFDFPFAVIPDYADYPRASLIVNDALDTDEQRMLSLKQRAPVVTFEDQGSGAKHADAIVNALYMRGLPGEYTGSDYAILRPEFQDSGFSRKGILVSFGGADPLGLTARVAGILGSRATYVRPPYTSLPISSPPDLVKDPSMGALMNSHSVIVTSGGRTVFEAAACGTPAIVIAQNAREATHSHLSVEHGNVFLGIAPFVTNEEILNAVNALDNNYGLQDEMAHRAAMSIDGKGLKRVVRIINEVMA